MRSLKYVFPVDLETFVLIVGGLLIIGLAVRAKILHPTVLFGDGGVGVSC